MDNMDNMDNIDKAVQSAFDSLEKPKKTKKKSKPKDTKNKPKTNRKPKGSKYNKKPKKKRTYKKKRKKSKKKSKKKLKEKVEKIEEEFGPSEKGGIRFGSRHCRDAIQDECGMPDTPYESCGWVPALTRDRCRSKKTTREKWSRGLFGPSNLNRRFGNEIIPSLGETDIKMYDNFFDYYSKVKGREKVRGEGGTYNASEIEAYDIYEKQQQWDKENLDKGTFEEVKRQNDRYLDKWLKRKIESPIEKWFKDILLQWRKEILKINDIHLTESAWQSFVSYLKIFQRDKLTDGNWKISELIEQYKKWSMTLEGQIQIWLSIDRGYIHLDNADKLFKEEGVFILDILDNLNMCFNTKFSRYIIDRYKFKAERGKPVKRSGRDKLMGGGIFDGLFSGKGKGEGEVITLDPTRLDPEPKPELEPELEPGPEPELQPELQPELEPELEPEPGIQSQKSSDSEFSSDSTLSSPESTSDSTSESTSDSTSDSTSESSSDSTLSSSDSSEYQFYHGFPVDDEDELHEFLMQLFDVKKGQKDAQEDVIKRFVSECIDQEKGTVTGKRMIRLKEEGDVGRDPTKEEILQMNQRTKKDSWGTNEWRKDKKEKEGDEKFNGNDYYSAIKLFYEALEFKPDDKELQDKIKLAMKGLVEKGDGKNDAKEYGSALRYYNQALEFTPEDKILLTKKAEAENLHKSSQKWDDVQGNQTEANREIREGNKQYDAGEYSNALTFFKRALRFLKKNPEYAVWRRAELMRKISDTEQKAKVFTKGAMKRKKVQDQKDELDQFDFSLTEADLPTHFAPAAAWKQSIAERDKVKRQEAEKQSGWNIRKILKYDRSEKETDEDDDPDSWIG